MLRTMLLVTGALFLTAGLAALAWAALALGNPSWRASADLATPSVGLGGVALLVAALVAFRISGRVGRRGDPAHAIDAAADD
ncbi:MAG: hypothetical protein INR64_08035 [Caulobacteraceae bacterium]|nr:hypothetical protein [Caulobacter sp.]